MTECRSMLAPDQHLGPYRLIARVGAGGMGEVWRAEDTRLGRTVAIKVLPPSVLADVEATARLKREARTAAQLYHPSIATIHSIEQDGDHIFIVEEFVEGESLTQRHQARRAFRVGDLPHRRAPSRMRWPRRMRKGSCTATSSRTTSSWPAIA